MTLTQESTGITQFPRNKWTQKSCSTKTLSWFLHLLRRQDDSVCQTNLRGGKYEYWHSKSITKPNLELLTHLVPKLESLSGFSFYAKTDVFVHYLSNGTLGKFEDIMEAELRQRPSKAIFGGFSKKKLFLCSLNITLHGNYCNSASKRATMVPKLSFEG